MLRLLAFPLRGLAFLVHLLPDQGKSAIAWLIASFWFHGLRIRRKTAMSNLNLAFPDMTIKDKKRIAKASLYNMCLTLLDFCSFPFLTREEFEKMVVWENKEELDRVIGQGRGVLAMSVHIGNGDWGAACLAAYGYPVHIISKVFKSKWLNHFWFSSRESLGVKFIPPRKSTYQILKALKAKEIVIFVLDQYTGPPNGVKTKFFGHDTGTAVGLALLASRAKVPVIPLYTYRLGPNKHVIKAGPPIEIVEMPDADASMQATTQRYNDVIEQLVRQHPDQWMWIHRRWKAGFA